MPSLQTFETTQPWVVYRYGVTHDRWWPFWNSTRVTGRARIEAECAVCGAVEMIEFKIPRIRPVQPPAGGKHPARMEYLARHSHPDRRDPLTWVRPLLNPAALR